MLSEKQFDQRLDDFSEYLPKSDAEAARKYARWGCCDPFYEEIEPALLNSRDILTYVAATGMIHPFHADLDHLHPATYAVPLKGVCLRWERDSLRSKNVEEIKEGKEFHLPQDSVAFLTLEPTLRIPDYIALRFNLRVDNAYRGLLLGTGPLVDPGFQGRLAIPLHNFTTNDYVFTGGERLIWMEFTKLSRRSQCDLWKPTKEELEDEDLEAIREAALYIPYELDDYETTEEFNHSEWKKKVEERDDLSTVQDYLKAAAPQSPVFSSTRHALDTANRARDRVRQISLLGVATTLLFIVFAAAGVFFPLMDQRQETQQEIRQLHRSISDLKERIVHLEAGPSAPTRSGFRIDASAPGADHTDQPGSQRTDDDD